MTSRQCSRLAVACLILSVFVSGCCLTGGGKARPAPAPQPPPRSEPAPTPVPPPPETGEPDETSYTVVSGDTLSAISQQFYGTMDHWRYLAEINGISDPRMLRVGQVLRIPARIGETSAQPFETHGETAAGRETATRRETPEPDRPVRTAGDTGSSSTLQSELFGAPDAGPAETRPEDAGTSALADTETGPEETGPSAEAAEQATGETGESPVPGKTGGSVKTNQRASLMSRPSTLDSSELAEIPGGITLKYLEYSRGYYRVVYKDLTGYIHARFVTEVSDE